MKLLKLSILLLVISITCSCSFKTDNLENATIYTTVYPLKYITEYLYGDHSVINSIYPNGVDLNNYTLTDKQIDEYSKGDLFIHLGYGNEKDIAKTFALKNKNMLVIDATYEDNYSLEVTNDFRELWLAPNNYINMLKNVKNALKEYLDNSVIEEDIDKFYNELYIKLSWMDAELRSISKEAKNLDNNTLVILNPSLKYLENYGFTVVCLKDIESSGSKSALADIKNKFKNSKYTTILKLSSEGTTDLVNELVKSSKAKVVDINDMVTNSDNTSDYISIQNENIAAIRDILIN